MTILRKEHSQNNKKGTRFLMLEFLVAPSGKMLANKDAIISGWEFSSRHRQARSHLRWAETAPSNQQLVDIQDICLQTSYTIIISTATQHHGAHEQSCLDGGQEVSEHPRLALASPRAMLGKRLCYALGPYTKHRKKDGSFSPLPFVELVNVNEPNSREIVP